MPPMSASPCSRPAREGIHEGSLMSKTVKHTKHDNVMLELDMLMRNYHAIPSLLRETGTQ